MNGEHSSENFMLTYYGEHGRRLYNTEMWILTISLMGGFGLFKSLINLILWLEKLETPEHKIYKGKPTLGTQAISHQEWVTQMDFFLNGTRRKTNWQIQQLWWWIG